jgi:hypothetical protein
MAELGEPVAIGVITDEEWKCPFEHKKPGTATNHLDNDSEKLATRVRNGWSTQVWAEEGDNIVPKDNQTLAPKIDEATDCPGGTVDVDGIPRPYSVAAHHLIPGDASLPKSKLMKFIKEGEIWGDIGYDVNGAENGLFLPTQTALMREMHASEGVLPNMEPGVRKWQDLSKYIKKKKESRFGIMSFQEVYAYRIMLKTGRQFHDAHPEYSKKVIEDLEAINVKLVATSGYHCDKCKESKDKDGKLPPPYMLVGRLNALSRRLAGHLWGNAIRWNEPYFTSRFARSMAEDAR